MSDETSAFTDLLEINELIGQKESATDKDWFESVLHERFTMRRPNGQLSTKSDFISGMNTGAKRQTTIEDLEVHGRYRAICRCRVEKWTLADPEAVQVLDNLRVFVRENGRWQLVTWLAEPI
ncbi:nuclear transport factor 2 family protein [Propionimicrobium sp. PCR01-08-3]|uniref:nuclear transport factor 2 family protein n=1 Tax=Propionimicrobium sp. PCR01-08-3 TaxID=3052086 RepID=UPI00255C93DF|nr:nuclear transport factor 2 family protein [Propionimicrobium sp. PCR01-08-3]WIY82857.1 nuclear transport factor 2 family protein [Propionimicrobium sp. PCR01-08-3]